MMRSDSEQLDTRRNARTKRNYAPENAPGLSIGQIAGMLTRHIWFIIICTLVGALAAFLYLKIATPIFEATATIRIDQSRASSLGINDLVSGNLPSTTDALATEIEVLQSDRVVIDALNSLPNDAFKRLTDEDKGTALIPTDREVLTRDQEDIIGEFKLQLVVKQVPDTQLVTIGFDDTDPKLAATVVNHVVSSYLRQNFDSHYSSVTQVTAWLSTQMQMLQGRAADAQKKLAAFQEQNGILVTDPVGPVSGTNTTTDRLRLLNSRLAEAEADRIVKQAQLQAATGPNSNATVLSSIFSNTEIQALQTTRGSLYAQYAQLSTKFGPKYVPLAQLRDQIKQIDAEIDRNVSLIRSRLTEEYTAAKTIEDMLRSEYTSQSEKAYALSRDQGELALLQSEVTSSRDLYNTLQVKLQQAGIDAGLSGVNTLPIDMARAPIYPVKPKHKVVLPLGTGLGLLIGLAAVFIVEASADKLDSLDQVTAETGYRPLITVSSGGASSRGSGTSGTGQRLAVVDDPGSAEAESYRRLRNLLAYSDDGQDVRTVVITSADVLNGKARIASNLAATFAQAGAKVLLVDAELRQPILDRQFSVSNEPGLGDALAGNGWDTDLKQPIPALPNFQLLPAGRSKGAPGEALASSRLRAILAEWRTRYDLIIINAAPLLPVSDSLPLVRLCDGVLLITRKNETRLRQLKGAREVLDQTEANVLGAIFVETQGKKVETGAYGETAYEA